MNDTIIKLLSAAAKSGGGSNDVEVIVAALEAKFPEQAAGIRQAVADSLNKDNAASGPSPMMKYLPWALAAVGAGGTMLGATGTIGPSAWDDLPELHVTNRWTVLVIIAAIGAVVGTIHSIYHNSGLMLPAFAKDNPRNMLVMNSYGFLGDLFYGIVAAVCVTWTALPTTAGAETAGNLLKWNLILSAAAAAFVGAKSWSAWRGNIIAKKALAQTATLPAGSEELRKAILESPTISDAAMLASGMKIPGHELPPKSPRSPMDIEQELFQVLDPNTLRTLLPTLLEPPGPDAAGLTIGSLHAYSVLISGLRQAALGALSLPAVANMSRGDFVVAVQGFGIDAERFQFAVDELFTRANEAIRILKSLPPKWQLTIERLPQSRSNKLGMHPPVSKGRIDTP